MTDPLRVLLVEDHAMVAMATRLLLEDLGCTVVGPAPTIAEAARLAVDALAVAIEANERLATAHAEIMLPHRFGGRAPSPPTPRPPARPPGRILAELARIDLDLPRSARVALPPVEREGAALVVVHPARVEPDLVPADALHYTARQAALLVEPGALDEEGAGAGAGLAGGDGAHPAATAARPGRRHERAMDAATDPEVVAASAAPRRPAFRVPAGRDDRP